MILANQGGTFRGTDAINLAPRFGFAWSPGGSDKTVVRGGFGIFYDAFPSIFADNSMTNIPNLIPETLFGVPWADNTTPPAPGKSLPSSAAAIRNGFANGASFNSLTAGLPGFSAPSINNFVGTFKTPRYQEYSLQIQQQLDDKSSVTLGYVGNHGLNIPITNFPNAFSGGVGGLAVDSLQHEFRQRSRGVLRRSFQLQRTDRKLSAPHDVWIHCAGELYLEPLSGRNLQQWCSGNAVQRPDQHQLPAESALPASARNYGNADYDIRNSFNAAFVWQHSVEVRQQVRERSPGWLDLVAELLRSLRIAFDGAGQHIVHRQLQRQHALLPDPGRRSGTGELAISTALDAWSQPDSLRPTI